MSDTKDVATRFLATLDALSRSEVEWPAVHALLAPGFRAHMPGAEPVDAAGFAAALQPFLDAFPGYRHEIVDQIAEGDRVATRIVWHATHRGEFLGIPASHVSFVMDEMNIVRVRDGRITDFWPAFDVPSMMKAIQPAAS